MNNQPDFESDNPTSAGKYYHGYYYYPQFFDNSGNKYYHYYPYYNRFYDNSNSFYDNKTPGFDFSVNPNISIVGRENGLCLLPEIDRKKLALEFKGQTTFNKLTKKQQWAELAKGLNLTGRKSWSSQSDTLSISNISGLYQYGNTLSCIPPPPTQAPPIVPPSGNGGGGGGGGSGIITNIVESKFNGDPPGIKNWNSISSSSNMNTIITCDNNYIYLTLNGGSLWNVITSLPNTIYSAVCSSGDGSVVIGAVKNGKLYVSTDTNHTIWSTISIEKNWKGISSSYNGNKIVAVSDDGQLYISNNKGTSWSTRDQIRNWSNVYVSPDGIYITAVVYGGQIYVSYDGGINWIGVESNRNWVSARISNDGMYMSAAEANGNIYYSKEYGMNWYTVKDVKNWKDIAMSNDGNVLVAIDGTNSIYVSKNKGVSWTQLTTQQQWNKITNSPNGLNLASCVINGNIWLSTLTFA